MSQRVAPPPVAALRADGDGPLRVLALEVPQELAQPPGALRLVVDPVPEAEGASMIGLLVEFQTTRLAERVVIMDASDVVNGDHAGVLDVVGAVVGTAHLFARAGTARELLPAGLGLVLLGAERAGSGQGVEVARPAAWRPAVGTPNATSSRQCLAPNNSTIPLVVVLAPVRPALLVPEGEVRPELGLGVAVEVIGVLHGDLDAAHLRDPELPGALGDHFVVEVPEQSWEVAPVDVLGAVVRVRLGMIHVEGLLDLKAHTGVVLGVQAS
mmetsp:Transcript_82403/g.233717  ORF Transcript_82403/g.233717 Transcript_82403/m.233717 type:complete len:269 (+) Transcript_82403:64-870(+)